MKAGSFYREPFDPSKHTQQYGLERGEYIKAHKTMGYNFQIEQAWFPPSVPKGTKTIPLSVEINNVGIAPFYYDWDIEMALLPPSSDAALQVIKPARKLSSFLPGQKNTVSADLLLDANSQGDYRLAIRIVQPGATAAKPAPWRLAARNTHIEFANRITVINAAWDASNALRGGWSVLGAVTVLEK